MTTVHRFRGAALALLAAAGLAACDNPVGEGSHIQPAAFEIRSGTTVLVTGTTGTNVTGQLSVQAGHDLPLSVHYFRQGQELTIPHGYWLEVTGLAGLAQWNAQPAGAFSGVLTGVAAGTTTVGINLRHGTVGSGHVDYGATVVLVVTP